MPTRKQPDAYTRDFLIALAAVGVSTTLAIVLRSRAEITILAMIHLLSTIVISVTCRRPVALFGALAGMASFGYFSLPHWDSFLLKDFSYFLILVTMLTVSLVITALTGKIRAQTERALQREAQARAMYQLSREFASETDQLIASRSAVTAVASLFDAEAAIYLPDDQGRIARRVAVHGDEPVTDSDAETPQSVLDAGQRSIRWLRSENSVALRLMLPLRCGGTTLAVLSLVPGDSARFDDPNQMHFLEAMCDQIASALDRLHSLAAVHQAELEIETERTRNALLNAVSHDIKTPLASIYGAATSLLEEEARLSPAARHELVESISDEAERLNRVVNNLLDMTRLDAGQQVNKDWRPLEEIVGAALARLERQLRDRPVSVRIAADLPWVCVDDVLMEQVFLNILENAVKYTPGGSGIEISAECRGVNVVVQVKDSGAGLPPGDEGRVFEKFFRGRTNGARGVGLGLAICRAIVEGHDGTIRAENSTAGGAVFEFELPIGGVPPQTSVVPETTF